MGGGIAMNFANVGIPVTIVEMKQEALDRGLGVIRKNYETTAKRGKLKAEDVEKRMGLLTGTLELEKLADCDLVIEAVFENMDVKKEVFGKLDKIVKQGAILASNTSYLNINEIAERHPASGVGDRPALLLARERDAPAGSGARREDLETSHRDLHAAGEEDRQDRRCWSACATASSAIACWLRVSRRRRRC